MAAARKQNGVSGALLKKVMSILSLSRKGAAAQFGVSMGTIDNWLGNFHQPGKVHIAQMREIIRLHESKDVEPCEVNPTPKSGPTDMTVEEIFYRINELLEELEIRFNKNEDRIRDVVNMLKKDSE